MKTTALITASMFALVAWVSPAAADPAPQTTELSACGGDKDGDNKRRKRRKGDSYAERSACGGDKDGDNKRRKRRRKGDR